MVPDRYDADPQTRVIVTDRDAQSTLPYRIRIYMTRVAAEPVGGGQVGPPRRVEVENHITAALARVMERERPAGMVRSMPFSSELTRWLQAWAVSQRPGPRGEWSVEVPVQIHRRGETGGAPGGNVDRITIPGMPLPGPPPPGRIDIQHQRVDEVLDELERRCGRDNPMSLLIQRWRAGQISASQAKYLNEPWAQEYIAMARYNPTIPEARAQDIRARFQSAILEDVPMETKIARLQSITQQNINPANRYIHERLLELRAGLRPRDEYSPERVLSLRAWVQRKAYEQGSVYNVLPHENPARCSWQRINFYTVLSDRNNYGLG